MSGVISLAAHNKVTFDSYHTDRTQLGEIVTHFPLEKDKGLKAREVSRFLFSSKMYPNIILAVQ